MPENMENQVDGGDEGGACGELQGLLDEEVSRCAAAGAGVPGQDVGRPVDEKSPTAKNDLMTICPLCAAAWVRLRPAGRPVVAMRAEVP